MAHQSWFPCCVICKKAIDLTESKTDECGQAVHEECYASKLISPKEPLAPGFELAIGLFLVGAASLQATQ